jgi:hypothetical protein
VAADFRRRPIFSKSFSSSGEDPFIAILFFSPVFFDSIERTNLSSWTLKIFVSIKSPASLFRTSASFDRLPPSLNPLIVFFWSPTLISKILGGRVSFSKTGSDKILCAFAIERISISCSALSAPLLGVKVIYSLSITSLSLKTFLYPYRS